MLIELIVSAVAIGLSLGVFGSGGAILTLPVLIYLLDVDEKAAVLGSLIVVVGIATVTLLSQLRSDLLSGRHIVLFAVPGILTSYIGGGLGSVSPFWLQISVFLTLMIIAASKLLLSKSTQCQQAQLSNVWLFIAGGLVGLVTGFVGVGGGFLIVPALVWLGRLDLCSATATSAAIIIIQASAALSSYYVYAQPLFYSLPWFEIAVIVGIGALGSLAGVKLKSYLPAARLNQLFGYFLLVMAAAIFIEKTVL